MKQQRQPVVWQPYQAGATGTNAGGAHSATERSGNRKIASSTRIVRAPPECDLALRKTCHRITDEIDDRREFLRRRFETGLPYVLVLTRSRCGFTVRTGRF